MSQKKIVQFDSDFQITYQYKDIKNPNYNLFIYIYICKYSSFILYEPII